MRSLGVCTLSLWLHAASASASSTYVPYGGYLEHNGRPVDGARALVFRLYGSEAGGDADWTGWEETQLGVPLVGGRFEVRLGEVTQLRQADLRRDPLFLKVRVVDPASGQTVTLAGRQLLGAVPYAWGAPGGAGGVERPVTKSLSPLCPPMPKKHPPGRNGPGLSCGEVGRKKW